MTEFQELIQDAPNFVSMERGELVAYAYGVFAAGTKANAENAKLRESLEKAAGIIADICGECPVSRYEWLSSDGCAERCGADTEEECWIAYLTGKRWDESGAVVDE